MEMTGNLDFWPADIRSNLPESPVLVLRKAASELTIATQGGVDAVVELSSSSSESKAVFVFYIIAKALNYRHALFRISFNPVLFYPVEIRCDPKIITVDDSEELKRAVKDIASEEATIRIIRALLAQSMSA